MSSPRIGQATIAEEFDVAVLLSEVLEITDNPRSVSVQSVGHLPTFSTVRVALEQVFLNLIGNAIERHRLRQELEETRQRAQHVRDLRMLEQSGTTPGTVTTANMLGQLSLREGTPGEFAELVQSYVDLIDLALEQRLFKVEHDLHGNIDRRSGG